MIKTNGKSKENKYMNKKKTFSRRLLDQRDLQMMVIPGTILILIFCYFPMYGLITAFQEYRIGDAIGFSKWVGLKHFINAFNDPRFFITLRNTLGISLLRLIIGFPLPIIFALMLNEIRSVKLKKGVQTISYLPHFVSWVFVSSIVMINILGYEGGILNSVLLKIGIIDTPIMFMGEKKYFWMIVVLSDIWKSLGWSAIIYIAAISSIDQQIFEAADVDGAGRFAKIRYITLPSLKPTIIVLLIFSVAGILNAGFEPIMLLTNNLANTMLTEVSSVIDTYVIEVGIRQGRFSYATAIGLFRSVVSVILLVVANKVSNKVSGSGLF